MKRIIAVALFVFCFSFSAFSVSSDSNTSNNNVYKIPAHVFIFENLFFPGAGHIYNDHLKLASFNFFTTFSALGGYFANSGSKNNYNDMPTNPSIEQINTFGAQNYYLRDRQKKHDKDFANSILVLAVISYLDGFIESYYAANKGWSDDLKFSVAAGGMFSGIQTQSIVNEGANIAKGQDSQSGGGITFVIRHGRLFEKDVLVHFGPHLIMNYDMTYYLDLNKWVSLSLGNQFDFQKKLYNYSMDFNWTSYDKYQVITDNIVLGGRLKPLRWMTMDLGLGIFNIATVWHSFSENIEDPNFSQKHAGNRGGFVGKYVAAKMNIDISKNFFISGRIKYLSSKEPESDYDATASYLKFFRIDGYLGYYF